MSNTTSECGDYRISRIALCLDMHSVVVAAKQREAHVWLRRKDHQGVITTRCFVPCQFEGMEMFADVITGALYPVKSPRICLSMPTWELTSGKPVKAKISIRVRATKASKSLVKGPSKRRRHNISMEEEA